MREAVLTARPRYRGYVAATFRHTLVMLVRRKRAILAGCIALAPVLIPLAMAFLSGSPHGQEGGKIFSVVLVYLYVKAIVPLTALFFGCMLIGEEVEAQTIPYVLTRPIPRSAWVAGKYLAFTVVSTGVLIPSILLTFFACIALGGFSFSAATVQLLLHYEAVVVMAVLGYGALCIFLGALVKRPVILGVVVLFGWQRLAMAVPGLVDFLTIEKYLTILLPRLAAEREKPVIRMALAEFHKKEFLIGASKAAVTLLAISLVFLILTTLVVRWREYSAARAVGGK